MTNLDIARLRLHNQHIAGASLEKPGEVVLSRLKTISVRFFITLERNHIVKAAALWDFDQRVGLTGVFVGDVFDEEKDQHIILVLRGVHPSPEFVAAFPERTVKLTFLDCH